MGLVWVFFIFTGRQVNNDEEWPLAVCSLMQSDHMHANRIGSKLICTEKKGTSFSVSLPLYITKIQLDYRNFHTVFALESVIIPDHYSSFLTYYCITYILFSCI